MKTLNTKHLFLPFILLLIVFVSACNRKGEEAPHWFHSYKFFVEEEYQKQMMGKILSLSNNDGEYTEQIKQFYKENGTAFWTQNGFQEQTINLFMDYLKNADTHGLSPDIFNHTAIQQQITELKKGKIADAKTLYSRLASIELELTKAYVQYVKVLTYGATNPVEVNGGKWKYDTHYANAEFISTVLKKMTDLKTQLTSVQPKSPTYLALQKELKKYISLKDSTFKDIPVFSADSGKSAPNVHLLGERLKLIQEIDAAYTPTNQLDATLMNAINLFRERRAIPTSSSIDAETIEMLNKKPQYYIDKLSVNLERNRWKTDKTKDSNYVAVNIPDFMLRAVRDNELALKLKICCGKYSHKRRKDASDYSAILTAIGTESPQLYSQIDVIYLNPEWGIPPGIVEHEYTAKFRRNAMATINKENLFFIDLKTKKQVLPESIDWPSFSHKRYKVMQASGPKNALGRIKFHITKSDAVYLHDTNSKGKFKTRVRAYSHGCIRVENPFELADLILTMNKYDEDKLEEVHIILGEKPETWKGKKFLKDMEEKEEKYRKSLKGTDSLFYREIRPTFLQLKKKMPVFIEYFTCFVDEAGYVNYRNDIYEKEGNILYALRKLENNNAQRK